jgi:hypothetical protein
MAMDHIIRQQYLHVVMQGTEAEALALQRRLPEWCQHQLTLRLARVLDRCAPLHEYVCLERLEIDVGVLSLEQTDWAEMVAQAVETSLRALIPVDNTQPAANDGNVRRKTAPQALHEAFAHFLHTGRLPWSFRLPAGKHLEQVLLRSWQEAATTRHPASLLAVVLPVLASVTARARLLRQFSPEFHAALLVQFAPEAKAAIDAILLALRESAVPATEMKIVREQLWDRAFADLVAGRVLTTASVVRAVQRTLSVTTAPTALDVMAKHWPAASSPSSPRKTPDSTAGTVTSKPSSVEPHSTALLAEDSVAEHVAARPPAKSGAPLLSERKAQDEAQEGLYLNCAGLVLLHPFLPRFFTALGIAVDDEIVQPERALCLLHYLATGQQVAPEYELILPKILCNVPLGTPVEAQVNFTAAELDEAVALLKAVIRHWEVLRDASIDGLRGTFLVRAGKVSVRADGDWLLQVEAKSFDILLEQLLWGIGMIKLPWMSKMLWVEWR